MQLTHAKPVEDYRRILDTKDIDWVLIATPEHWHFQMAMDALDAGKHVYVEKPMTHTMKQAKKLAEKVKSTGLKLQVGVQGMSDESYAAANEHVKAGELGKVVLAQIDYSRNYEGDFWAGDDYPIDPDAKPDGISIGKPGSGRLRNGLGIRNVSFVGGATGIIRAASPQTYSFIVPLA